MDKYKRNFPDLRQSKEWAKYMELMGWEVAEIKGQSPTFLYIIKTPLGRVAKLQRPFALDSNILASVEDICKGNKCLFLKVEPGDETQISTLEHAGFTKSNSPILAMKTMVLNLTKGPETLAENFSERAKRNIKKAESKNIQVVFEEASDEAISKYLELQSLIVLEKRSNFLKTNLSTLKALATSFGLEKAFFAFAYQDKELLGMDFILTTDTPTKENEHKSKNAWYLFNAVPQKGRESGVGHLLLWETIKHLHKSKVENLDLEGLYDGRIKGAYKGWEGFTEFKQNFGGDIVEMPFPYLKAYNPIFKLLKRAL